MVLLVAFLFVAANAFAATVKCIMYATENNGQPGTSAGNAGPPITADYTFTIEVDGSGNVTDFTDLWSDYFYCYKSGGYDPRNDGTFAKNQQVFPHGESQNAAEMAFDGVTTGGDAHGLWFYGQSNTSGAFTGLIFKVGLLDLTYDSVAEDGIASFGPNPALAELYVFHKYEQQEADTDGDGVNDDVDNCPAVANPGQEDADDDGVGDSCDNCPGTPAGEDVDDDGCSASQLDADDDGVNDDVDNCPAVANPGQEDADGDGVGDACDNCPEVSNDSQADADNDGKGDACDACPNDPNDDEDGDGLCADVDNCPDIENPNQQDLDGDGDGNICDDTPDKNSLACLSKKVKESGNLCKAIAGCAKKEIKDLKDKFDFEACTDKAKQKSNKKWDTAENKKIKGQPISCFTESFGDISELISMQLEEIYGIIVPDEGRLLNDKAYRSLAGALVNAVSKMCVSLLNAESTNINKNDATKLQAARDKAHTAFVNSWNNAVNKSKAEEPKPTETDRDDVIEIIDDMVEEIINM
ncbi:exported hypothetical protein [uncultured Desulfobacterium sp.]|uniref:Cartilage oligomeric matrix protein n=1 Tax=uncultured Desulfobacterium sp. TaxID=201089 RepID=A0A445MUR4_9BACT|nr:exported hypothetical protein [uncultured Desulfobacterium sp.]